VLRHKLRTRITTRVIAISAVAATLLGVALVILIVAVTGQRDASRAAFRSQEALAAGTQLENSMITIENGLRGYAASGLRDLLDPVNDALRAYEAQQRRLGALVSADARQQARVGRIARDIQDYLDLWARPVIRLADTDPADARSQFLSNPVGRERLEELQRQFDALYQRERTVIRAREDRAEQRSSYAIGFGIAGFGLVLAVAWGFTAYLRRSLVRPVLTVADATGRVADGDLDARVPSVREDELGDLARSFNTMADSLQRSHEELERSNAELSRSNAELEQFASVTSHDLQAPLTTISMYAELLERRHGAEDPEKGPALVDGIRHATGQARQLIRDLLEYSRAGRGRLALEEVQSVRIVDQALEALAGSIEQSGAEIQVGPMPTVLADRANLCRVFQNLVGNAVKFTRGERPEVSIQAERDNGVWRFSVADNGIGMEPSQSERIFEPFQRLHGEEDYPGTGIGLAVCERIVAQHGGRIWVESTPGEGSVFSFTLPAVRSGDEPDRTDSPPVRAEA
jgi:signal transduction histidine kinase